MVLKVRTQSVRVGNHDFRMRGLWDLAQHPATLQAADPAAPDDGEYLVTTGDDGRDSYSAALWPLFGVIWPAGLALARLVDSMELRGARLLEVGCGLGLAGVVAHRNGVDVTMSDHHPMVPVFLEHNVLLNGLGPLPFRRHDFQAGSADGERYDVIIGSDVLYERGHAGPLARFLGDHLRASARVLIIDPGRHHTAAFGRLMEAHGMTQQRSDCALPGDPLARCGRVLAYQR